MTGRARILVAIAALLVGLALLLPLWEVRLVAPQYPEGLGLRILARTVVGIKPNDLQSINGLNHYIGMKTITPDAIPELHYMPWVVVGLVLFGLGAAWRGTRRAVIAWLAVFLVVSAVGLWDFHRWEFDYGHNLDMDEAIIVVPGMSYQPPLLGSKQLLNFRATSWPSTGAIAMGAGFLLTVGVLVAGRRRPTRVPRAPRVPHLIAHAKA